MGNDLSERHRTSFPLIYYYLWVFFLIGPGIFAIYSIYMYYLYSYSSYSVLPIPEFKPYMYIYSLAGCKVGGISEITHCV